MIFCITEVFPLNWSDRCEGMSCKAWEKCVYDSSNGVRCVCRDNLECPADFQPVCGSDTNTYNNYCILKATACRQGKEIEKTADGPCTPGMPVFFFVAAAVFLRVFCLSVYLSVCSFVFYSFCQVSWVFLLIFCVCVCWSLPKPVFSDSALVSPIFSLSWGVWPTLFVCLQFSFASTYRSNLSNRSIQQLQGVF